MTVDVCLAWSVGLVKRSPTYESDGAVVLNAFENTPIKNQRTYAGFFSSPPLFKEQLQPVSIV
jgi:hypothetical protein